MAISKCHRFAIDEDLARAGGPHPLPPPPVGTFDVFNGTTGDDNFNGTSGNDTFNMADGGDDTVSGGGSADIFNFGNSLTAADKITGGNGNDTLNIDGNYTGANALVFAANTIGGVENLVLGNASYDITMNEANVTTAVSLFLRVDGSALTSARTFTFDGSAETDGRFDIFAGDALATIVGSSNDDTFNFGGGFTAANHVDGKAGTDDELILDGDYSAGLTFAATTIANIDRIRLTGGHSYELTLDNGNVTFHDQMIIDGSGLGAINNLAVDGSDETSATLIFEGGAAGNCIFFGGGGDDTFFAGPGNNFIKGGDGDDRIFFTGASFTVSDTLDGGSGFDTLFLAGPTVANFDANTIKGIEEISLAQDSGAASYNLTLNAASVGVGQGLTIDGSKLDNTDGMSVNALAVTGGEVLAIGGAGFFLYVLSQGAHDVARGGALNNTFNALGNLEAGDRLTGHVGTDNVLILSGDYSDRLDFDGRTIRNIESIQVNPGNSYNFATADGNVAAGAHLSITGLHLGASDRVTFDGSKETNGTFFVVTGDANDNISGGAGNDTINAGNGNNTIDATRGGSDTITTFSGNDIFKFGAALDNGDVVNTGTGTDTLFLDGDYSGGTVAVPGVDVVKLAVGNSYKLSGSIASGTMSVAGTHLGPGDVLTFTGSGTGTYLLSGGGGDDQLTGGDGNDNLTGNTGNDRLKGGLGQDNLNGGAAAETFVFGAAGESTSITFDKIASANFNEDRFDVVTAVTGIDGAVLAGLLRNTSKAVFDGDLATAMSGHLNAGHAILFTCNGGNFIGHKFLIVDQNGAAGYQADVDLVIEVTNSTGTLGTSDFI